MEFLRPIGPPEDYRHVALREEVEKYKRRCEVLETELETFRERDQQKYKVIDSTAKILFKLTTREFLIFNYLARVGSATKEKIFAEVYLDKVDDPPEIKIIDVFVCKMRKKLAEHGIKIETQWGIGYCFSPVNRTKILEMVKVFKEAIGG